MKSWLIFLVATFPAVLVAQPDSLWSRTFGGTWQETCYGMKQTADHGYILVGQTLSFGAGDRDAWLVKTDSNGIGEFSRTLGGPLADWANAVCQTTDGGFVVAGRTYSFGVGGRSVGWIVKIGPTGDSLWSHTWDSGYQTEIYSVESTSSGGLILAGLIYAVSLDDARGFLLCTDPTGNPLWTRTYTGSGHGYFKDVIQTSDGGFVTCGTTSAGISTSAGWVLKTDAGGTLLWSYAYDPGTWDILNSVNENTDGNLMAAGSSFTNGQRLWIAWLGPEGSWYGIPFPWMPAPYYEGELTGVGQLPDGSFWFAGSLCCNGNGSDFVLVRDINSLDIRTYGGDGPEWCYAATFTND